MEEDNKKRSRAVVLASASPQRKQLLEQIDIHPYVLYSDIEEDIDASSPTELVTRLAELKAESVLQRIINGETEIALPSREVRSGAVWIIGADTVINLDGKVLGKPVDCSEAKAMLEDLSGRSHDVLTGVCVMTWQPSPGGSDSITSGNHSGSPADAGATTDRTESATPYEPQPKTTEFVRTKVFFSELSNEDIVRYLDTDEWRNAAGAYRIQARGACLVKRIEGSYSNVVGLPLHRIYGILCTYGYFGGRVK